MEELFYIQGRGDTYRKSKLKVPMRVRNTAYSMPGTRRT